MNIVRTVKGLREAVARLRLNHPSIALVPTMGALHAGHISLVERAHREADAVIVSIFVNPTQFAAGEDFSSYPRTEEDDLKHLASAKADLVFIPSANDIYPPGFDTTVVPGGAAKAGLEDRFRPDHFQGVATVVAKLFLQSRADVAVFGEKDFQQLRVISRMATDLDIPIRVIGHETVREPDGLALSSRNRYLSAAERQIAPLLYRTLKACAVALAEGGDPDRILAESRQTLTGGGFMIDYLEARNAQTLLPVAWPLQEPARLLTAVRLGKTRLIDNVTVTT